MSMRRATAALSAGRRSLRQANPELEKWSREQFHAWLAAQRYGEGDASAWPVVVIASLTSIDDLLLHVGVVQLLCEARLRRSLLLVMATPEAARLARSDARRAGWEGLVCIADEDQAERLMQGLPPETNVALFQAPTALAAEV